MRLDYDHIRELLLRVEEEIDKPRAEVRFSETANFKDFYHADQLVRAGFLRAIDVTTMSGGGYIVLDLTFEGHQLLNKMRNDTIWQKTKSKIAEVGGAVPLRILEKLLDHGWDNLPL
ncbi:DUF2513 domain-containing protein [Daeguia caeni]|uniref:DUF2513 domain-containing protein n=1 Tax=Daeguia caeni TaxID=439612 RepID=A0ABV9H7J2_9HYPH